MSRRRRVAQVVPGRSVPMKFPSTRLPSADRGEITPTPVEPLKPMTLPAAAVVPPIVLPAPPTRHAEEIPGSGRRS